MPLNRGEKYHPQGFTLVEILVALMIFSIIMTALFSSFRAFLLSSETVMEEIGYDEKIQDIFNRISRDIESVYILQPPRYKKPGFDSVPDPYRLVGKKMTAGQKMVSFITFSSLAHARFGEAQRSGVARISYYIKENPDNTHDLFRADDLSPFPDEPKDCSAPVLGHDISGFEIIYKDRNGEEHQSWDSESEEFDHTFPASMDIKLTFGTGEKSRIFDFSIGLVAQREPIE